MELLLTFVVGTPHCLVCANFRVEALNFLEGITPDLDPEKALWTTIWITFL